MTLHSSLPTELLPTDVYRRDFFALDRNRLANWLTAGLKGSCTQGRGQGQGPKPFAPMDFRIGRGEGLEQDLFEIFSDADASDEFRAVWRETIGQLLFRYDPLPANAKLFFVLLSLADLIECDAVFERLDQLVNNPMSHQVILRDHNTLSEACFRLAVRKMGGSHRAWRCIERLMDVFGRSNLPGGTSDHLVSYIVLEMCKASPDDWRRHFLRMDRDVARWAGRFGASGNVKVHDLAADCIAELGSRLVTPIAVDRPPPLWNRTILGQAIEDIRSGVPPAPVVARRRTRPGPIPAGREACACKRHPLSVPVQTVLAHMAIERIGLTVNLQVVPR